MKRMSTLSSERRNDLHLTSTGVALARRHSAPLELPSLSKPLLSSLPLPSRLSPLPTAPTTNDIYQSTTATTYTPIDIHKAYTTQFKKAPGHQRVNYMLETHNKLESKPWRRSLTMANQKSETRAQFCGQPELIDRVVPSNDPQPSALSDHFSEGPTKELVPSTSVRRRALAGRDCVARNDAVLDKNQPYLTTNHRFHHRFSKQEQLGYARKDAATYWLCEDYPKAWGHGTKDNPLTTPTFRSERGPMRDRTVFRTGTRIPRVPPSMQPLSQTHHTVYSDTYTGFDEEERRRLFYCPVQSSSHTQGYDSSLVELVPQMYKTGNMTYGASATPPLQQTVVE